MLNAPTDLKFLGVGQDEVKAALARERRPGVRRRLVAVGNVLDGKSIKQAARAAKATQGSVERWLGQIQRSGFQSLLVDGRHGHAKRRMKPNQVTETRRQIATAFAVPLKPQVRARLIAIDRVLSGTPIDEVAASAGVLPDAVKSWLRTVTYDGIGPTLARCEGRGKPRPRQLNADPAALRELASKESNSPLRRQMLALALLAEGMSPHAAALTTGAAYSSLLKRIRRFQKEGTAAFRDEHRYGHARKLNEAQIQELRAEILKRPDMSYRQLYAFVAVRFGAHYSFQGLRLLLKSKLGIARKRRRFVEAPRAAAGPLAAKSLAQQLDPDELRAALARTNDHRLKRRLIALIQLAQGWEPDRVALQVGAAPETLGNWVALYHRVGVRAFHPTFRKSP